MKRRIGAFVALVLLPGAVLCGPAAAQAPGCDALVGGRPISDYGSPEHPLSVDADARVPVLAAAPPGATRARVDVVLPVGRWTVVDEPISGGTWGGTVDVGDVARFGAGIYRVEVVAGACRTTAWVRITGTSPL